MEQVELEQIEREAEVIEYPQRPPEVVKVRPLDSFVSGLFFGLGFGLAVIVYGLIGLGIFYTIVKELMALE